MSNIICKVVANADLYELITVIYTSLLLINLETTAPYCPQCSTGAAPTIVHPNITLLAYWSSKVYVTNVFPVGYDVLGKLKVTVL